MRVQVSYDKQRKFMKKIRFVLSILVVSLLALECKKDSAPSDPGSGSPLTEQEKQAILQNYQAIASTADTILTGNNPIAGFQAMLPVYRAASNVENAFVTNDALYVKFRNSGVVGWHVPAEAAIPPYDRPTITPTLAVLARTGQAVNTVCLVNTMDDDESRRVYRDYLAYLKRKFTASGWQVTEKVGIDADVLFFKTGLKQFGALIIFAHGKHDASTGVTYLQTGEAGSLPGLLGTYQNEHRANQMSMYTTTITVGGQKHEVPYYAVSDKFIQASYAAGDFPGTVVYLGACQGLKDPNSRPLGQAFVAKGAAAVIGWTEMNSVGPSAAKRLFAFLLCGKRLVDARAALPREDKTDNYASAILTYYPETADNVRLVPTERHVALNLVRPQKDSSYATRTITLQGNITGGDSLTLGTVELNAVALRLEMQSDRRSFLQQIGIKSGTNSIRIAGLVDVANGCACVDTGYTFQANFDPLELWTELRWTTDTDVDFHLLRPGASFPGEMWTVSDCYYGNKVTTWGAFLDVDNTSGRGPEHITIPTVSVPGVYRLFVHYYSSRGITSTSAYVSVSVRNGPNQEFGPMGLATSAGRGGDVWEVCTIDYPSGTVTRVMTKTTLAGFDSPSALAHGKKK